MREDSWGGGTLSCCLALPSIELLAEAADVLLTSLEEIVPLDAFAVSLESTVFEEGMEVLSFASLPEDIMGSFLEVEFSAGGKELLLEALLKQFEAEVEPLPSNSAFFTLIGALQAAGISTGVTSTDDSTEGFVKHWCIRLYEADSTSAAEEAIEQAEALGGGSRCFASILGAGEDVTP